VYIQLSDVALPFDACTLHSMYWQVHYITPFPFLSLASNCEDARCTENADIRKDGHIDLQSARIIAPWSRRLHSKTRCLILQSSAWTINYLAYIAYRRRICMSHNDSWAQLKIWLVPAHVIAAYGAVEVWYDIFIKCNWVVTRWQYTFTHK
jgi:hypothetical protein